jgi:hypothetical protein
MFLHLRVLVFLLLGGFSQKPLISPTYRAPSRRPLWREDQHQRLENNPWANIECPEDEAEEVVKFIEEVIVAGMDEMVNPGLDAEHPDWVRIEADAKILESWGR